MKNTRKNNQLWQKVLILVDFFYLLLGKKKVQIQVLLQNNKKFAPVIIKWELCSSSID